MSKKKAGDNLKVPVRESTMRHPETPLPPVVRVGSLVRYWPDGDAPGSTHSGWVIQTPMMPGGQTNSYLVVPFVTLEGVHQGTPYAVPARIDREQIIEILEPELP